MSDGIPKELSKRGGNYYNNQLFYSKAYQTLTKSSRNLLHDLINELRWSKIRNRKHYTNNGEISFTEIQYKKRHGSSSTYLKARDQLIEVGLIKQTYRGGRCRGDMAKYKIFCIDGVSQNEKRWEKYPNKNWVQDIPKKKNNLVGNKKRWKKGQSGRKLKPTLQNNTHNSTLHPTKQYSYKNKPPVKPNP